MCPMPAMVQFFVILVFTLLLCHGAVSEINKISCSPKEMNLTMDDEGTITCNVTGKIVFIYFYCC